MVECVVLWQELSGFPMQVQFAVQVIEVCFQAITRLLNASQVWTSGVACDGGV